MVITQLHPLPLGRYVCAVYHRNFEDFDIHAFKKDLEALVDSLLTRPSGENGDDYLLIDLGAIDLFHSIIGNLRIWAFRRISGVEDEEQREAALIIAEALTRYSAHWSREQLVLLREELDTIL